MAGKHDATVTTEISGIQVHGSFKRGLTAARDENPLLVLIHGGGTNASYFDNKFHSIPTEFASEGFDVLNINRAGYGGNPVPDTKTPIFDSIPVLSKLIRKAYEENSGGKGGVIIIGHSLGAATSLIIAALEGDNLPLLGVSALGIIPNKVRPTAIVNALNAHPESDRVPLQDPSPDTLRRFMGFPDFIDESVITDPSVPGIFEPGLKTELLEWLEPSTYERFVTEIAPRVKVPLQYLAAEIELGWLSIEEGQPIFDEAKKLFVVAPKVEGQILPGGAHDFEFSRNSSLLREKRLKFISELIRSDRNPAAFKSLPILDLALANSPATKISFLEQLQNTLINVGFFYLTNTGIPSEVQDRMTQKSIEFFELPLEQKLEIEMVNSKHFLGYARLGTEITAQKPDFREQCDFATEVPAPGADEPQYRNLRGPNQWPSETTISGFRPAIETYLYHADHLAETLTSLIAEALDLDPNAFDSFFDSPQQNKLKIVKYPPPPDVDSNTSVVQGVGPHRDSAFLTLLLQGTEHIGLEVQNKNGSWIQAPPIPNTLIINIGRALEALTGGLCVATTHRVNLSPANFKSADGRDLGPRYSFPVFQGVSLDLSAKDINLKIPQHVKDLVLDEEVKAEAEATFNAMFENRIGEGTFVARVTSHQDVGARWYPDVLEKALKAQQTFST